jgi:effector-binding domain-containing protein
MREANGCAIIQVQPGLLSGYFAEGDNEKMSDQQGSEEVKLEELAAQPYVGVRATVPVAQLGDSMGERMSVLKQFLGQAGVRPTGSPFVRYYSFGEVETDFVLGAPLAEQVEGEGPVSAGELPGGPAVSTWHFGPHDQLGLAYGRIASWIERNEREPDGPSWEVYHWIDLTAEEEETPPDDPSSWRVQLVQPLKQA